MTDRVRLATIVGQWSRIGAIGFGGPPAHIALLRELCVQRRGWMTDDEFEDGVAATNLLPGPASTQMAIYCAWRLRGATGAVLGGVCFILPGLLVILALSAILLGHAPHRLVLGLAGGAGAAVAAVAVHAAGLLVPPSWRRAGTDRSARVRWLAYLVAGALAGALVGASVVLVLILAGMVEIAARRKAPRPPALALALAPAGIGALSWTALKVGALSYGGGFVIIPLMQTDAVERYHWMTPTQFLYAVALGQITPGPVVHTVAVVGYAAAGLGGALLAALLAFSPSFIFILVGASRFDRLRANATAQAFLGGAGPAAIGAIAGSAVPLAFAIEHVWQIGALAAAAAWLLALRRGVVVGLLIAAAVGLAAALLGWPV
jgi:chromate transporter